MKRTTARLADGREIIYFDSADDAVRDLDDPRDLPETATASEIRYDPLLDEWVAIASHRQTRTHLPPAAECPLCPSTTERQTEIPSPDYDVVVFENRFPSFAGNVADVPGTVDPGEDLFPRRPGIGRCEVVCFTSDHETTFSQLTPERVRLIVEAWTDRTSELTTLANVEQVFCFENKGEEIGVTLHHPHGQIYAYPFVTPRTRRMLDVAHRHRERTGRNLFADVLAAERAARTRIVAETVHWTAFVPAASRWPIEVHLYPHRHVPDLPALTDDERDDFARLYLDVLRRMDGLYGMPMPYIAAWQQAPVRIDRDLAYLHLQLFSIRRAPGKLKYLAGSESGMGSFINDVIPEEAARRLRDAG
ncbi:galactose-1-phosphate uridylyltransferase [Haloechinothrix halophila]|uniref:galactose-1-phosphate uridylyltransferase n=1 Tax=Haloechinothrix halophila TaxID=1069073 RepID=UPI0004287280|nr:galactose-1-phosphate uridylyltransferase [Haloechinothrix halophila]